MPVPAPVPVVVPRLLGQFDTVLLGHRDRSFVLPAERARRVNAGGGMIAATVLVDGLVAGVWRRTGRRVAVELFERIPDQAREAISGELDDIGRFLGERLTLGWAGE